VTSRRVTTASLPGVAGSVVVKRILLVWAVHSFLSVIIREPLLITNGITIAKPAPNLPQVEEGKSIFGSHNSIYVNLA